MEIIDTVVTHANGELTVEFLGQGGDVVHVHFVNAGTLDSDAQAIEKARAVLVQVATFSSSGDDLDEAPEPYDRGRNQTQGEVTCVLEYMEAGQTKRTDEVSFVSVEAMAAEVERSAIHVVESFGVPEDVQSWAVRAVDADANVLAAVTFEDARRLAAAKTAPAVP